MYQNQWKYMKMENCNNTIGKYMKPLNDIMNITLHLLFVISYIGLKMTSSSLS